MNIRLIKKFLYFGKYRMKCAIGKRGITSKKIEGDQKTPKGTFRFRSIFYRKDRIYKIKTILKKYVIKNKMGWCDDVRSKHYNKNIMFPFDGSAEKLWLKENIYDLIVVINYNLKPVVRNKGSAIFLHVARRNYKPTRGCIAVTKKDLILLVSKINNKTKLIIY
tara:strand:- start:3488 stop:3979 length:492 start_codon:yes stop_codon:yes gene_type:complete